MVNGNVLAVFAVAVALAFVAPSCVNHGYSSTTGTYTDATLLESQIPVGYYVIELTDDAGNPLSGPMFPSSRVQVQGETASYAIVPSVICGGEYRIQLNQTNKPTNPQSVSLDVDVATSTAGADVELSMALCQSANAALTPDQYHPVSTVGPNVINDDLTADLKVGVPYYLYVMLGGTLQSVPSDGIVLDITFNVLVNSVNNAAYIAGSNTVSVNIDNSEIEQIQPVIIEGSTSFPSVTLHKGDDFKGHVAGDIWYNSNDGTPPSNAVNIGNDKSTIQVTIEDGRQFCIWYEIVKGQNNKMPNLTITVSYTENYGTNSENITLHHHVKDGQFITGYLGLSIDEYPGGVK